MPGSRACVHVRAFLGRVGQDTSGARFGAPHLSCGRCAVHRVFVFFLFGCFFLYLFLPLSSLLSSRAPAVSGFSCFPALGALGLGALCLLLPPPQTPPFFVFLLCFVVLRSLLPCALRPCSRSLRRSLVPGRGFPLFQPPLDTVFFSSLFSPLLPRPPPPRPPPTPVLFFRAFFLYSSHPVPSPLSFVLLLLVPRTLALCGCPDPPSPPPPSLSFCFSSPAPLCASLVSSFPLFQALGALGPGASSLPSPLLLRVGHLRVVCALCAWAAPPPPPRRPLVFCCVSCLVVWCRGLLWAVLCGSCRFAVFFGAVWCWCRAVWCIVLLLVCCCAVLLVLALVVSRGHCFLLSLLASCGALLYRAVFCAVFYRAWRCRALPCGVLCSAVFWCAVSWGRRVRRVVLGFSAFPPPTPAAAPCCRCLVPCRGSLLCSVLGCGAVLVCCAASRVVCCFNACRSALFGLSVVYAN